MCQVALLTALETMSFLAMLLFFSIGSGFPGNCRYIHCIWVLRLPAQARRKAIILVFLGPAPIETVATLVSFLVLLSINLFHHNSNGWRISTASFDGATVPLLSIVQTSPGFQYQYMNLQVRQGDLK
jgi:hypothetical protein